MPAERNSNVNRGRPQASPADATAMKKQALEAEHAERQAEENREAAAAAAAEQHEREHGVTDYFENAGVPLPEPEKTKAEDLLPYRDVRIKATLDQVAYGRKIIEEPEYDEKTGAVTKPAVLGGIRFFDFEEGRQYRLPREFAEYLDAKGYVFH